MKNKFMTKALAVVLSASMALSLSSATALTANAAAAPKLAKKTVSVKAGKKAKNKLQAASYKAGWRITKATVKKTAVAKAKVKKNKKVVVVTGVKKGATKIVLKLKNAKTGAAKKLKFKAKVKVVKPVVEEPTVEVASLTDVKQTAFDTAVLTFDRVPDTDVTIDTLKIYEGDKEYVPVAVVMSADKLSATVTYSFAESTDTVSYTYTFKDANLAGEKSFTTGKYTVGAIDLEDQTVEAGSLQPIKFALKTADGLDVTKYGNFLSDVSVEFTGDDVQDQNTSASNPQVYLSEKDKTCKVTITYLAGQEGEIKKEATITAVQPTATAVEARFKKDNTDKWYINDANEESLAYDSNSGDKTVYFYGKAADASKALGFYAVKYDSFDIKSSNDNVATVSVESVGKAAKITITPGTAGTATITLTATEDKGGYRLENSFSIPVRVTDFNDNAASLYTSTTSISITNAKDNEYSLGFDFGLKNTNDQFVSGSYSVDVVDSKGDSAVNVDCVYEAAPSWDNPNKMKATVTARGAKAGTYRILIEGIGVSGSDTKTFNKTVYVKVTDVFGVVSGDNVVAADIAGKLKYEIELSEAALKIEDADWATKTESKVRIKALSGSNFVGYVRRAGDYNTDTKNYVIGHYKGLVGSKVEDDGLYYKGEVGIYVLSGAQYVPVGDDESLGNMFYLGSATLKANEVLAAGDEGYASGNTGLTKDLATISIYSSSNSVPYYFGNAKNEGIAAAGNYSVIAYNSFAAIDKDGKLIKKEGFKTLAPKKTISVSYNLTMPKIDYNNVAGNTYATPDKDFLSDDVDTSAITIIAGKLTYAKAKTDKEFNKTDKFTVTRWINSGKTSSPAAGDTVYAVSIVYTDRGIKADNDDHGNGVHFVVETTKKIVE